MQVVKLPAMFCAVCGNEAPVGEKFCRVCGSDVSQGAGPPAVLAPPAEGTIFPAQTSGKAIASLISGLFIFAFPLSIVAIVLGHLAIPEIRKSAGRLKGERLAFAGLILGYIGLAAIPVILILAAIIIPNVLRAVMAANEASAIVSVRQLVNAENLYSRSHPSSGYACRLSDLADARLIDEKLASSQKNGYNFEVSCRSDRPDAVTTKYLIVAYPSILERTGQESFCSDESGLIKTDITGSRAHCMVNGSVTR